MATPYQYTVQGSDYGGLNAIARRHGFQNYQQAGITSVPSGNFDLIRPGDVINFGNAPRPAPAITTTGPQWDDHNNATNGLNSLINEPDPYLQLFQQQRDANKLSADNAVASATAANERATMRNEQDRNATEAGLATAAAKTGLAPNSAYQLQVMQGAQDQFNTRFALLDQEEKLAIAKAKNAQRIGDTAVLKEQLDYATKLRDEKAKTLQESQKMEWEKYKFEHLSAAQQASEKRLGAKAGAGAGIKYTNQELKKLRAAGIDPTNLTVADNFLYNKGAAPNTLTPAKIKQDYSTGDLWNLALAMGIPRVQNGTRQDEINALFANPQYLTYVQQMLSAGHSIQDIIDSQ